MTMIPVPTFETERLVLRAPGLDDVAAYTRHFVDYEVVRHLAAHVPWPYPEDGVRDFLVERVLPRQGRDRWFWGLFPRERDDELIGAVELWTPGDPENRGFWLGRAYWGRGLMSEAVEPVTAFAFEVVGLERLTFCNALGNDRSRRVKEKSGARFRRSEPASFVDPVYREREIWTLEQETWRRDTGSGRSRETP